MEKKKISEMSFEELKAYRQELYDELGVVNHYLKNRPPKKSRNTNLNDNTVS